MRVLIFGGNGRVAKAMTSLMLAKSWNVTSVIRNPSQKKPIQSLNHSKQGTIDFITLDLKDLKGPSEVEQAILDNCRPDCVVIAAGSFSDVYGIDHVAAKIIIKFPASRQKPAPWWDTRDVKDYTQEKNAYPDIGDTKLQSDEYLVAMARKRNLQSEGNSSGFFQAISLRPSWLLTSPGTGKVHLGRTRALGGYEVDEAIQKAVGDGLNSIEGEDVEEMYKLAD
ncbi:uncharacterized protein BDV14DRAFT_195894 [Aspergillus stella-maris]|uniref:uncharacterized protein n=1 Tax=Aspergillus stella-maris TaxID=1810926 RepID=UPI003CCCA334